MELFHPGTQKETNGCTKIALGKNEGQDLDKKGTFIEKALKSLKGSRSTQGGLTMKMSNLFLSLC